MRGAFLGMLSLAAISCGEPEPSQQPTDAGGPHMGDAPAEAGDASSTSDAVPPDDGADSGTDDGADDGVEAVDAGADRVTTGDVDCVTRDQPCSNKTCCSPYVCVDGLLRKSCGESSALP